MIAIVGGGIGGLTLALMFHARGLACRVFEAAAEVRPLGVGINALPHAIRELMALDLLPALDRIAIRTRQLTYMNHLGQAIWTDPRGLFAGHEAPQFSIHRGHLQTMLWDAARDRLGEAAIRSGARVLGFETTDKGVTLALLTSEGLGETLVVDALVAADGIHSMARAALHPSDPGIRWNGIEMWRGAVDWPAFDGGDAMVIAGDAMAKLVLYPIGPGSRPDRRLTNWVVYARTGDPDAPPPAREGWSRRGTLDEVRPLFRRLKLPFIDVEALIEATGEIFRYPMCDRDPLPFWGRGRVTLLGDAAHPMYPVGSNGASQAILDARCLADALVAHPVEAAFRAYEDARRPTTAAIVQSNRRGGPERVIDLVAQRAPEGFDDLAAVASHDERAAVVGGYATLAGFAVPEKRRARA